MLSFFSGKSKVTKNELAKLGGGVFYAIHADVTRERLYERASALIRRTTTEHNYELVVVDDDDQDGLEEQSFLIDAALLFRTRTAQGKPAFAWRNVSGESDDMFEFVVERADDAVQRSAFEVVFLQCAWERKEGKSHDQASDEQLEALKFKQPSKPRSAAAAPQGQEADLADELANLSVGKAAPSKRKGKGKAPKPAIPAAPAPLPIAPGETEAQVALQATADLYLYDPDTNLFLTREKEAQVSVTETGRFLYSLAVASPERLWLIQTVSADMNFSFAADERSAVWNYYDEDRRCYSWLLRFADAASYQEFQHGFTKLLWETLNEEKWEKAKSDQREYMYQAYEEDTHMPSVEERESENEQEDDDYSDRARRDDEEAAEVAAELDQYEPEEDADNLGDALDRMPAPANGDRDANSQLAVGYKFDRSFVVRGNRIGVFKHNADDQLEFSTTIENIRTPKGKDFKPRKVMLHDQDSAMVMMDPHNKHSLYKMDLEYGKIVDEWKVHEDVEVDNVLPGSKFAQTTAQQTLLGHSHNGIFRIDPRLSGLKLVDSEFKQYASKNAFSSAATDEKGRLAVASNKGDIRLFDKIGKNAKTALPALGDPIIGVDVTADGRYVIATCKTYLLLIDTLIGSGRYQGELGFDRAFPADAKPIPRRLQLKPHHVAYMDEEVSFTQARFDAPPGGGETSIVTATGPYIVSWPLDRVKRGRVDGYTIRKLSDTVVEDNFAFGSSNNIIVAMPEDLQMHTKATLRKPTRNSLAGGGRASRSS